MGAAGLLKAWGNVAALAPGAATLTSTALTADYDFSDPTKLFTDTARTVPVAANDDPIGGVLEPVSGHHLAQATAGFKPLYKTNIQNGLSIARSGGTFRYLTGPALSNLISNSAFTVYWVGKAASVTSNNANTYDNQAAFAEAGGYWGLYFKSVPTLHGFNYDGTDDKTTQAITVGAFMVVMYRHEAGNLYTSINGGAEVSVASGNTADLTGGFRLHRSYEAGARIFDGDTGRLRLHNAAHGAAEVAQNIAALKLAWGIA